MITKTLVAALHLIEYLSVNIIGRIEHASTSLIWHVLRKIVKFIGKYEWRQFIFDLFCWILMLAYSFSWAYLIAMKL